MVEVVKQIIRRLITKIAGNGFDAPDLSIKLLIKCLVVQKILGINRNVDWPVHHGSEFLLPEKIQRGTRYPGLARYCRLDARNGIILGKNTWIGPHASLLSMNHDPMNLDKHLEDGPIVIGNNCWLCAYSIILPGIEIADHTVVAANAVVTKSYHEQRIVLAGNPARIVKRL